MHTLHNERIKLVAALFNTKAGSGFTVGIATPFAGVLFYHSITSARPSLARCCGLSRLSSYIVLHRSLSGA
jgi:hypothetical protein